MMNAAPAQHVAYAFGFDPIRTVPWHPYCDGCWSIRDDIARNAREDLIRRINFTDRIGMHFLDSHDTEIRER